MDADICWAPDVSESKFLVCRAALDFVLCEGEEAVVTSRLSREASVAKSFRGGVVHPVPAIVGQRPMRCEDVAERFVGVLEVCCEVDDVLAVVAAERFGL